MFQIRFPTNKQTKIEFDSFSIEFWREKKKVWLRRKKEWKNSIFNFTFIIIMNSSMVGWLVDSCSGDDGGNLMGGGNNGKSFKKSTIISLLLLSRPSIFATKKKIAIFIRHSHYFFWNDHHQFSLVFCFDSQLIFFFGYVLTSHFWCVG